MRRLNSTFDIYQVEKDLLNHIKLYNKCYAGNCQEILHDRANNRTYKCFRMITRYDHNQKIDLENARCSYHTDDPQPYLMKIKDIVKPKSISPWADGKW